MLISNTWWYFTPYIKTVQGQLDATVAKATFCQPDSLSLNTG